MTSQLVSVMKDLEESLEIIIKPHTVFRLRLTAALIKDFLIKTSITGFSLDELL